MSDIRFNRWLHQSGTGGVYQASSGNVGIGTSVPSTTLDVNGSISATSITATTGTITGNLSVGGVLTYDDVTNIDSVGVVTARAGINISGGNLQVGGTNVINSGRVVYNLEQIKLADAKELVLGSGNDLKIQHSGSHSFISQEGVGALKIKGDDIRFEDAGGTEAFRITSTGNLFVAGTGGMNTTQLPNGSTINVNGTSSNDGLSVIRYSTGYGAYGLNIGRSKSDTIGTNAAVTNGNDLGHISFYGADGTDFNMAAQITSQVDGTPSDGTDMPGRLVFKTSSDGNATPTERLRITSAGKLTVTPADTTSNYATTDGGIDIAQVISSTGTSNSQSIGIQFSLTKSGQTGAIAEIGAVREGSGLSGLVFRTRDNSTGRNERLRINSDGKIGINETSPTARLDINHPNTERGLVVRSRYGNISTAMVKFDGDPDSNGGDGNVLHIHGGSSRTDSEILHIDSTGVGDIFDIRGDGLTRVYKHLQLEHASNTAKIIFNEYGSNDPKAQIEMDQVSGSSGMLRFYTEGSTGLVARMLITPQGYVKATPRVNDGSHGAQSLTGAIHEFGNDGANWVMRLTHTSGAASENEGLYINYKNTSPNNTGNSFIHGGDSNGVKFRFASNGGLYNYSGNNSNLSDEREKKNIVSLDTKWDKVKSWDIKKFHYNEDADTDDLRYGVIAQQVEEHCPEVVSEWTKQKSENAVLDEDGNVITPAVSEITRKGVKEQQMMWMAIKALQEAQTRIETLEAQVAALQSP